MVSVSGKKMQLDLKHSKIPQDVKLKGEALEHIRNLKSGKISMTGWVSLPNNFEKDLLERIERTVNEISEKCNYFVVVGIGGSYLGARAVIEALDEGQTDRPEVDFAGYNMSGPHLAKVIRRMQKQDTCICAISKSGNTLETILTYSILKEEMFKKYGSEAKGRIYIMAGPGENTLRKDAEENGFELFNVPEDIGGRYSVLSVVGLLPIAVAGLDISALLAGAQSMTDNLQCADYACARVALQNSGKFLEVFNYFDARMMFFGFWLQQLFAESEGKAGKGAYPTSLCFPGDLHSVGQFLQQGRQIFFETMIQFAEPTEDLIIPKSAGNPYAGKTIEAISRCFEEGVLKAHSDAGVPIIVINVERLDEFNLGKLIHFFEMSAAISAMLLGVNPFDQPGVESYKSETKKLVEMLGG